MKTNKTIKILDYSMPIIAIGVLFALWAITAKAVGSELLFPSISSTFSSLGQLLASADFYKSVGFTLLRSLAAFLLAFVCAITLAVLSAFSRRVRVFLSPLIALLRVIPTMSVILLSLVWVSSDISPVLVAFIIIFPLIYGGYLSAIDGVDKDLIEMCRIYGVSKVKTITTLYVPQTAVSLLDTVRNTLGLTLKLVIAAEVLAQTKESMGLGMQLSKIYLDTPVLLAWTIAAIVLGGLMEVTIILIKRIYLYTKK
ncbi:MAG: ABC transporter permease [Christensenellales bacterium]